ncbi:MAG: transposase [Parvularculaceae bacterium]
MSGEIIIDSKRKRSWPKELKRQIVAESDAEGVTVCDVARRYDIEPSQLFHWRKQFRDEAVKTAEFLPVELSADQTGSDDDGSEPPPSAAGRAEILFPNGRRLLVAPGLARALLDDLVGSVASAS